jgi:hypothetical protein
MSSMVPSRAASLASAVLISASLVLVPIEGHASPGWSKPNETDRPIEGPARPPGDPSDPQPGEEPAQPPGDAPAEPGAGEVVPPPPTFEPGDAPGIEFVVPPPESDEQQPTTEHESPLAATFPDPGVAPNDGNSVLVLSGTTIGLTVLAFTAGLAIGLDREVPLAALLPGTIIPAAGVLAFSGGGLYLGIKRARAYHRWELAYRVVGEPQGAGLNVGATFMLLGAFFCIPAGAFALDGGEQDEMAASLLAIGGAAAISTPIMYTIAARRKRSYERTGGWHRRPIPPIPGESESRLQVTPLIAPTFGGLTLGAGGRF